MSNLSFSVYVSAFARQKPMLEQMAGTNTLVFTSFHIQEEFDDNYTAAATKMCCWLKDAGFRIMGDVSPKTLRTFSKTSITDFAADMNLDILRLDYGFELDEIIAISRQYPIAFNASTVDLTAARRIAEAGGQVYAMHNFYPRPETALDDAQFTVINNNLTSLGIKVLAFIPGDEDKRGPVFEGLPTLEKHRRFPPYVAYMDMAVNFRLRDIFIGDMQLSMRQLQLIRHYCQTGIISVPAELALQHHNLYDQVFTIRPDSPLTVKRLQESREYSCPGASLEPKDCAIRKAGSVTMDNKLYGRYSGEVQILGKDYPQDDRVNIIGNIAADYLEIIRCLPNGSKMQLVRS